MNQEIDLQYRPKTYFRPEKLEKYLLSQVKGAALRTKLKALFEEGRHAELRQLAGDTAFSAADRKILEAVHPMFMGGNYLPDTEEGEVEIARITIRSTTYDVTCVYARPNGGTIHYRVVDEYGGDTLQGPAATHTTSPMTLGEFADFFLTAWPLVDLVEMNFEDDLDGALGFFSVESEFYPDLDQLCRQRVREHYPKPESSDECPFCGHFNSPPAGDVCTHAVAWVWDGQAESLGKGEMFATALEALCETISSVETDPTVALLLEKLAERNPLRQQLIDASPDGLEQVLVALANAQTGEGWSTDGMLSGSGYTICIPDLTILDTLGSECRKIADACKLNVQTENSSHPDPLESLRPQNAQDWQLAVSGFWADDIYHSGHIAYYITSIGPGQWILEGVQRSVILDGLTQEDVDEGRLSDDQLQAMWGISLEEAQASEHREICAACSGASEELQIEEIAEILYRAICEAGGKAITEPDESSGLFHV